MERLVKKLQQHEERIRKLEGYLEQYADIRERLDELLVSDKAIMDIRERLQKKDDKTFGSETEIDIILETLRYVKEKLSRRF